METFCKNWRRVVLSALLAFVLLAGAGANPMFAVLAHASAPAPAAAPGGASGAGSIFDAVGDDGSITDGGGFNVGDTMDGSIAQLITRYRAIAVAITGVLTITMFIFMLFQFAKLGGAGDNEMARKKAVMGILTTGVAVALLGGSTIVIGFFWNMLVMA